jgi:hypothetical protein
MTTKLRSFVAAAAVAFVATLATPALAGKGGSAGQLRSAVASGSVDAIIAEIERTESLMCGECLETMTNLVDHDRYEVREAAGWWFAKRPTLKKLMIEQMVADLGAGGGISARNAADFLGAVRAFDQLGALSAAYDRGVSTDTRFAIIRAAGVMGSRSGSALVAKGMTDADPGVRALAASAWRGLGQTVATPAVALLSDPDAEVRAQAAATVGGLKDATGRVKLEALVVSDPDANVRRNAAWALGLIGLRASDQALATASNDPSPLVRGVARASRLSLR